MVDHDFDRTPAYRLMKHRARTARRELRVQGQVLSQRSLELLMKDAFADLVRAMREPGHDLRLFKTVTFKEG